MDNDRVFKEIWTIGRRQALVCVTAIEYENGAIVASAEDDKITDAQLRRALKREYPHHTFYAHRRDGYIYAQADPCGA